MGIEGTRIALRQPVAHRDLGTVHIIPLVYGNLSLSFNWYFIASDGTFDLADWRTKLTAPGMVFANIVQSSEYTSCQLFATYSTGDPGNPIWYAPQLLMGEIVDPRTGKQWDSNIAFYSNLAN